MSACAPSTAIVGGSQGGVTPPIFDLDDVFDEIRWDQQPTAAIINGNNNVTTVDGNVLAFTGTNVAASTIFEFTLGVGLRWTPLTVNTEFTSASRDCSYIDLPFSTIFNTYGLDTHYSYTVQHYYTVLTFPSATSAAGTGATAGLWGAANVPSNGTSAIRVRGVRYSRAGAGPVPTATSVVQAANGTVYTGADPNVLGYTIGSGFMACTGGTWGGTWETSPLLLEIAAPLVTETNPNTFKDSTNRHYIAFGCGAIADCAITLQRTLLRAR